MHCQQQCRRGESRCPDTIPGKIILDLAVALALGGDCLADVAQLRVHPEVFGPVASDSTVSRLVSVLAADADAALAVIEGARVAARKTVWSLAGDDAPDHGIDERHPLVIDLDATLVTAHSEKEHAASTFKRASGFTRCVRSSTTATAAPGSRWRCYCGRVTRLYALGRAVMLSDPVPCR